MASDSDNQSKTSIDAHSRAADWDDSLFDDVIDPFQQMSVSERTNGQLAGRRAGYLEGRDIGRSKGWEIGLELGYIKSFASNLLDGYHQSVKRENSTTDNRSDQRLDRCIVILKELIEMINSFPDPDILLEQNRIIGNDMNSVEANASAPADPDYVDVETVHNGSKSLPVDAPVTDVTSSLQRIRAKFKLLSVLLRTNRPFDLKRLLNVRDDDTTKEDKHQDNKSSLKQQHTLQKDNNW